MSEINNESEEAASVRERYARRKETDVYSMLRLDVQLAHAERMRKTAALLSQHNSETGLHGRRLVDLGCGTGSNLLDFVRLGFAPENLVGLELLEDRLHVARRLLPPSVQLFGGDARNAAIARESVDYVFQSVVFSSLLSEEFRHELAEVMWSWLAPGGAVIWYDFTFNNPNNPDVRGVSLSEVRALFPEGLVSAYRVTLAPPIARRILGFGHLAHQMAHALPFLRTHILAWIQK